MCLIYRQRVLSIIEGVKTLVYSGLASGEASKEKDQSQIVIEIKILLILLNILEKLLNEYIYRLQEDILLILINNLKKKIKKEKKS